MTTLSYVFTVYGLDNAPCIEFLLTMQDGIMGMAYTSISNLGQTAFGNVSDL